MEFFFILIIVLYTLIHFILYVGFKTSLNLKKILIIPLPKVSVIVSARNEENNIVRCINSLKKLNYSKELLEIILVNDNSIEKTFDLMIEHSKGQKHFQVINSRKINSNNNNLRGKANAIDTAIEQSTGEIIFLTDADCEVPPGWINETLHYYDDSTAMVCGFAKVKIDSLFAKMQCVDWMYLLTLASSSAALKMTLSCVGNNLSFRKSIYYEVGGYESIDFSITEDLALMRKIQAKKIYKIKFPVDNKCLVETLPCKNLSDLFSQKRRWFRGGTGVNILGYFVGFELYLVNILLVTGLFFLNFKIYILLILIKIFSELFLVSNTFQRFNLIFLYKYYPLFVLFFAFYGLVLPFTFIFKKNIYWKGRKF